MIDKIKVVFMGTPDFAVPVLEGLIENYEVVLVVSQPDKKTGRHQVLTNTPVKNVALKYNIPCFYQFSNSFTEFYLITNLMIYL